MHRSTLSRRRLFRFAAGTLVAAAAPKRGMIVRSTRAEDVEMPLEGFLESYLTPIDRFFVRSHHYVPTVDAAAWRLQVKGKVASPLTLSLDELKKLPRVELVSVLECAGNGRGLYEPSMAGLQWTYGSVGNARWTGVRLADVLKKAGPQTGAIEVLFDGADVAVGTQPEFQRGIPFAKAMDPNTLLAYEMNGEPLPQEHGFPLRVIVPGWAGDSWAKWLTSIEVRDTEFDGFFMKTGYRHPGKPVAPGSAVDPSQMKPVTSLQVKSIIASHVDGESVIPAATKLRGAAWSNESPIASVEVSTDGGRIWKPARLGKDAARFGWRQWEFDWTPPQPAYYSVMVRARNTAGETQPMTQEWNPSGYGHNVVQEVHLNVAVPGKPLPKPAAEPAQEVPAVVRQTCLGCHGEEAISQQRLSRTQWEREIEKMQRWGARVTPDNKEALVDYLSKRYPYRPRK
ncbi:MAG: molybdopterin-dependent oxidoreductase [Acidobacteria bacterium]|nr:molybdopterin-dependent oxidoreductase [Acidobacteriota bacterium]